jgi:Glycosyl transferases group 1
MPTLVSSLTRAAARAEDEPLNILTFPTHEAYQVNLAVTGHRFYLLQGPNIKTWNHKFRPLPPGHVLLEPAKGNRQVPHELELDLVLSQNKFGQFPLAVQISRQLHLPLISLEHTLPPPGTNEGYRKKMKAMRGHVNVFISEYSRRAWDWHEEEARVIHHGVDTDVFYQGTVGPRKAVALSVVNDWVNRDWCCGFRLWQEATAGLPVLVLGDTPGLSQPAPSLQGLVGAYQTSRVFVNTSLVSPIPTALLEAMACGCACVSTSHCMVREVIEHGKNGLLADTPTEIRAAIKQLLADPARSLVLGQAARETIVEKFGLGYFVQKWDQLFCEAANFVYTGAP